MPELGSWSISIHDSGDPLQWTLPRCWWEGISSFVSSKPLNHLDLVQIFCCKSRIFMKWKDSRCGWDDEVVLNGKQYLYTLLGVIGMLTLDQMLACYSSVQKYMTSRYRDRYIMDHIGSIPILTVNSIPNILSM